jgi:hypothetical protein
LQLFRWQTVDSHTTKVANVVFAIYRILIVCIILIERVKVPGKIGNIRVYLFLDNALEGSTAVRTARLSFARPWKRGSDLPFKFILQITLHLLFARRAGGKALSATVHEHHAHSNPVAGAKTLTKRATEIDIRSCCRIIQGELSSLSTFPRPAFWNLTFSTAMNAFQLSTHSRWKGARLPNASRNVIGCRNVT